MLTTEDFDTLMAKLIDQGWHVDKDPLPKEHNLLDWYAWHRLSDIPDCKTNDRPPSVCLTPYLYSVNGVSGGSVELTITADNGKGWFQLNAYGISPRDVDEKLGPAIESLKAAWRGVSNG